MKNLHRLNRAPVPNLRKVEWNRMESGCELSSNADSNLELVDPCLTKPLHNCKALAKTGKGGIHMDPTGSNPIGGLERPCPSWSPTNASECVLL